MQSFRGASLPMRLPAELTGQLQVLSRREGATLFMVLLAGFEVLLARYSGQRDFAVGTPVAGRHRIEIEGLVGFFVNTLVLRSDLTGDQKSELSFRKLLGRVRETTLAAHAHQDLPFEMLVQELSPERSLAHAPLVQVMLALQNLPHETIELEDLSISPAALETRAARFDLELTFTEQGGRLSAWLAYAVDLFDPSTISRQAEHLLTLLEGVALDPDRRLQDHPLLSESERHQLRTEWNDTATPAAPGVVELFEEQARRSPEAVAATLAGDEGARLTYGELDLRADRLAVHLRTLGVGPGIPVAVCVEHTPELAVAVLGVLKSGGAYLPLDPTHPPARLAFLLKDAEAPVLVTQPQLRESLPPTVPQTILLEADDAAEEIGVGGSALPAPGDLAYMIYTSGTTGRPKAVLVEHGMLATTLAATRGLFHFGADDRMPCLALSTFDISLFELFSSLLAGGTAVFFPLRPVPDVERLVNHLGQLTCLHAVPALMRQVVDAIRRRRAAAPSQRMRSVFVGGDVVPADLLEDLRETFPAARVWVLYGPTEGTILCAAHPVPPSPAPARPLLGRPLAGSVLHVCDAEGELLPVGVPGELWIGGAGVSRGYLGRDELNAEKYVRHGDERLYRTGDRVRRLADGTFEFLGRLDEQVKIRGIRIEPREIEAALLEHPGVHQVAVVPRNDGPASQQQLVAYLVAATAPLPAVSELRSFLAERLPAYMMPAFFVTLDALPLTPNGKVDRTALPAPDTVRSGTAREFVSPRTRAEELLAGIWAQVLRLPRIGVNENFFELGGDSILSLQIVARARQAGLLLTVRQVFEHQTVAALALHTTAAGTAFPAQEAVSGEVPLTPVQCRFFEQGFAEPHRFNQALLLEPREPLSSTALERAMAAVVEHHDALRLRFSHGEAGDWRQENIATPSVTPFHRIDLSGLPAPRRREALELAAAALQTGFDLSFGPLTRLAFFETDAEEAGLLMWATHHLVVDGVSWRVLLEDLEGVYRQVAAGLYPALPPKTTSFRDWAIHLTRFARSGAVARELDHWVDGARISVPPLPVDFPAGENTLGTEASVSFDLTAEETADLLQTVPSVFHNRIDEALLSALTRALAGWTGSPRLRVDLEGHGREPFGDADDLDASRTVGWFTTIYPVVLEAGNTGPGEALVSAKERLRAVPGHGLSHGLLRYLRDGGDGDAARLLATAPEAEVGFNYLGQLDATSAALSLFRPSLAALGSTCSPRIRRTHVLEVSSLVSGGRLRINLSYSSRMYHRETAERLAAAYAGALRELVQQSRALEHEVFSPSDFPKARLDARSFDKLVAFLSAQGDGCTLTDVEDIYPLSPLQNGMLFHSLTAPGSGVYVNQVACTLSEDLDPQLFRQAWATLVGRHGSLRTAFIWDGLEEPLQIVHKSVSLPWQDLDWRDLPADEKQRRSEELRQLDRLTPLALGTAPLMRFSLVRLGRELGFVWTVHHLLLDGWSLPLLVQELVSVYAALKQGREPVLPPVRPFSEYIVWLQKQDLSQAETFWRQELAGFTSPNPLSLEDRIASQTRPAAASGYAEHQTRLSREVTADLQALATLHRLTLQTVTLGAWAMLVNRYSREEDVVFGGVVSGRPAVLPGVETMIGLFINTLPVRARASDAVPLAPWLQHLQERQLAREEFEHSPLSQIQRWSDVPPGSPLFETLYVFENYPAAPASGDGGSLRISNLVDFATTNYPLTLTLTGGNQIPLRLAYDRSRIEDTRAQRLLHHFAALLSSMARGSELRLGELSLLTDPECHQLLREWNDTATGLPPRPVHELFVEQVKRSPETVAMIFGDQALTYAELDHRSNQLARRLRALGVATDTRVGLCVERSPEMIVAVLGILKAGAAYVPLDPVYPQARLAFMVEDARIQMLLTQERLLDVLPQWATAPLLLDADWSDVARESGGRITGGATPESLGYVIYTSGSTGRPKGVALSHGALRNLIDWHLATLLGGVPTLQFASLSFDASFHEMFACWGSGGTLVVVPEELRRDMPTLAGLLVEQRIEKAILPVVVLQQLAEIFANREALPPLREITTTGERLQTNQAMAALLRRLPGCAFHNHYGPSETHVATAFTLSPDPEGWEAHPPVGRPIWNSTTWVLEPGLEPAPLGVFGELYIGGVCLARGYLDRPALTAEKFVPDPFSSEPGARLYRTGDKVRLAAGGDLEFLERFDDQVKIRGFRIELGEIEAVLIALAGVREAVVLAREDTPGDWRLVAYIVSDVAADTLRQSLRERLPEHMVPAAFVRLAALPLTPNGKVDRKALPAPEWQRPEEGFLAPRTPVEEVLAGIWAEVLGLERIGAADHFFDLGGHSLLATRVMSRLREALGVEMPLRVLFEAPALADLAARVEAARRDDPGRRTPPLVPIAPGLRDGALPLSFAQQRLWFIDQLEPGSPLYNIPVALRVEGPLNSEVLALCLGEIVRRHEALRTVFAMTGISPVQVIQPAEPFRLTVVDLSALPNARREALALTLTGEEALQPFDLTRGPLLRTMLLRLAEHDHLVAMTMHHIVSDGWSMGILIREITALYAAFAERKPSPLPELPVQYADFAVWQHSWLHGEILESEISYWRRQLAGLPPRLELPTDRPRPAVQSFRGTSRPVLLPAELTRQAQIFSRREGATLFMVLLAAFQALLARYSGQQDLAVGTPVAGRNRVQIEGLIGFFINTLVLRGDLAGEPSFRALLGRVRETTLAAHTHQDVPFEKLVQELAPERSLAHTPLFQVMLVLQNAPTASLDIQDLRLRTTAGTGTTARFDLTLTLQEWNGGLSGTVEHATDLFDGPTIDRLIFHYERLLSAALAAPERMVFELPLLGEPERQQALIEWNDTGTRYPEVPCLHDLVEAQVARTPDAPALLFRERRLTYQQLNAQADTLARRLRTLGCGPDVPIGIFMERCPEMVVALLGVLKAGGAYLPLDPEHPSERIAWMLTESRVPVVLAQEALLPRLPPYAGEVLCLDAGWDEDAGAVGGHLPRGAVAAGHIAYVLYTSGSTGRPKGVMIPHHGIINRLFWMQETYDLRPGDRVLQKTPFGFDVSVWELFWPLATGASLVIAEPGGHRDPGYLADLIARTGVTVLHFVPSMLQGFLAHPDLTGCGCIRLVICSGEELPPELRWRFKERLAARLENLYGPTEASVDVTWWSCARKAPREIVPIGRPVANTRILLLDPGAQPVPPGVPGELHIGGVQLARGYLARPDLTAERFVPDPFGTGAGERLYRTGDLARWLPDGTLDYAGRIDHQVKVRGLRIELGEIEAVLSAQPGVERAVVVVRQEGPSPRLVAYVVPGAGQEASLSAWREALQTRLPAYMVPDSWVMLPTLPLTTSGKVDRRALPVPESPVPTGALEAPRTAAEQLLATFWAEVLRLERVGLHDNFFALGGDSILSLQVVARAARHGLRITPRQMFEYQTLAALAAVAGTSAKVQADQGPVTGPVQLTPIQRWFFSSRPAHPEHHNQSLLLEALPPLTPATVHRAFAALLLHHDALRLRVSRDDGSWRAWNEAPGGTAPWLHLDLSALPDGRAALERAAGEAQASLDLTTGPLLRAVWFDLPAGGSRLLLAIHHLAVDGVSWRILLEDLTLACRQLLRDETIQLPPKTTAFQEWAERLTEHARSMAVEPEISWWRREVEAPAFDLPLDHPEGANTEASARHVYTSLSAEETDFLLREVPAVYRTQINDVLLTALAGSLAGSEGAVRVDLEGHGREEIFTGVDLSRTVGWLTSLYPVRIPAGPADDPGTALKAVKEHLRAIPGRGLGWGLLRWLREDASTTLLGFLPAPAVIFNYLGQLDQALPESPLFAPSGGGSGAPRSPRHRRSHALAIGGFVVGGRLHMDWEHSETLHQRTRVEGWAAAFLSRLRELIEHCRCAAAQKLAGYTPSDFPLAGLGQPDLDRLLGTEWGVEEVYPLSPLQEGILFHSLFERGSGVYVEQLLACLQGELAPAALESAIRWLVEQHPILRTSFHGLDLERPLQVVHGKVEVALDQEDWRGLAPEELERRLDELLQADRRRGFDPVQAPLIRWKLLHTGDGEHRLLWSHHHLLLDGWSFSALAAEFFAAYAQLRQGDEPGLPRRRPFRDYIAWLESQDPGRAEEHWRRALAGWREPTPLPGGTESGKGAPGTDARNARLSPAVTAQLHTKARSYRITLNTLAQAAWGILLGRYSGRGEVLFGATVSGRPPELPGIESMIGLFINTLPVRLQVEEGRVGPWLEQIQAEQAELRQFEHSHLVEVQAWSEVPRGTPLFESILVFENFPRETSLQTGRSSLEVAEVRAVAQTNYPLTVIVAPADQLQLRIAYDASRFDAVTVDRMLVHLQTILERLIVDPARCLTDLPLVTEAERLQLLGDWNDTQRDWPRPGALHELFEQIAEQQPGAAAVLFEGEEVTYRELEQRANRLAQRLLRLGVMPETRIGLGFERSPEALVAMLGVLKAAGTYVPLDPESPRDRLAAIVADAGISVLLTHGRLAVALSGLAERTLALDDAAEGLDAETAERPRLTVPEDAAAYVIYTSGSTGVPKGVIAGHRGVVNFVRGLATAVGLEPADRLFLFAPLSFDASVLQIFPALTSGASLTIHRNPRELGSAEILELCGRCGVTVLDLPAALWRQWVEEVSARRLDLPESLRAFLTGGEKVPIDKLRTWASLTPRPISFLSSYGPTEATVTATVFQIRNDRMAGLDGSVVPIGRPLPNVRTYSLDAQLRPRPWGAPGELYLGGEGLARGYLGRPDLTAEVFVPDPLSGEPGARLYRTGDLACHRPDGNLEFWGRADLQVKLRGFRVEPGEIEAALRRHPAVREAAVLLREDDPGEPRLVAYIISREEGEVEPATLRTFLSGLLPAHMVPSAFVLLAELPVLPSGKLDRTALPAPEMPGRSASFVAPRDPLEQILAEICGQVLKVERVGAFDNFFELGGHSLLATQVLARIRQVFEIDLQLRTLFEEPTISGLAAALRSSPDSDKVEHTAALRIELASLSDEEVRLLLLAETTAEKGLEL